MINLAIYLRVSTGQQTYSRQEQDIRDYISKIYPENKYNLDVYAENISGFKTSKDRPELTNFLQKVEENPKFYKCLYISELSRIGRNPIEARSIITNLLQKKIDVCVTSTNGGTNFLNPDGSIDKTKFAVLGLLMDFAQIEIDVFKERSASGLRDKILNGGVNGGLFQPYGYGKSESKKLVIDDEEAKVIKFIFEQYSQGFGMGHIANLLIEKKVKTRVNKAFGEKINKDKQGNKVIWSKSQIHKILSNSLYCGIRTFRRIKTRNEYGEMVDNSETFDATNIAIISKELFDKCAEIRINKKANGRNMATKNVILLQYLTTCGCCGRNYTHKIGGGKKLYICSSTVVTTTPSCSNIGINIDLVDSVIYDILCSTDTVFKYLNDTEAIKKDLNDKIKLLESTIPFAEKELKENEQKIERLLETRLSNAISHERFVYKNKELETVSNNLTAQLKIQRAQLKSNKQSLKNLSNSKVSTNLLKEAKNDRNKLKSIFKQLIKNVEITGLNYQFVRLDIKLQVNNNELDGILKVIITRKGIRKKPYKFQYQANYIGMYNPSEEFEEDYYERLNNDAKYNYLNTKDYNEIVKNFNIVSDENIIILDKTKE
jgi:site-specific DNA recombinase